MTEMERLALGEAEISGFQADEKLRLFSIPCVPTIISLLLFIISHHQYATQFHIITSSCIQLYG